MTILKNKKLIKKNEFLMHGYVYLISYHGINISHLKIDEKKKGE